MLGDAGKRPWDVDDDDLFQLKCKLKVSSKKLVKRMRREEKEVAPLLEETASARFVHGEVGDAPCSPLCEMMVVSASTSKERGRAEVSLHVTSCTMVYISLSMAAKIPHFFCPFIWSGNPLSSTIPVEVGADVVVAPLGQEASVVSHPPLDSLPPAIKFRVCKVISELERVMKEGDTMRSKPRATDKVASTTGRALLVIDVEELNERSNIPGDAIGSSSEKANPQDDAEKPSAEGEV